MERKKKKLIYNVVVSLLLIAGLVWVCSHFVHLGSVAYTDNAQVKQLIVPVNSRVQGFIKKIYFDEYQEVRKGDTLALIEDSEFRFRLAQAEADFQNAISGKNAVATTVHTTQNNIAVSDAGLQEAKVRLDNAEREYHRYKNPLAQDAVTKQQYDAVQTGTDPSSGTNRCRYQTGTGCFGIGASESFLYRYPCSLRRNYRTERYSGRAVATTRADCG